MCPRVLVQLGVANLFSFSDWYLAQSNMQIPKQPCRNSHLARRDHLAGRHTGTNIPRSWETLPSCGAARENIRVTKTVFQFTAYKRPQIVPLLCVESNRNEHVNFYYCTSTGLSWEWLGSRPGQCTYYATLRRSDGGRRKSERARQHV